MRFCKQRDRYSCGPVALLNVDKFFGRRVTYANLPFYRLLVQCSKSQGTLRRSITRVLGRAARRKWPNAKQFLQEGNCILIFDRWKGGGHYSLVVMHGYDITLINHFEGECLTPISAAKASRLLKHAERTWYISESIL